MANWHRLPVVLSNAKVLEQRELLGMNVEEFTMIRDTYIDLDRVESFGTSLDENGDQVDDSTDIEMISGVTMVLTIPVARLLKLIKGG